MKSILFVKLGFVAVFGVFLLVISAHTTFAYAPSNCNLDAKKLQRGSIGTSVKKLQRVLAMYQNDEDFNIDGVFGRGTKSLVMSFQHEKGLKVDGVVGNGTRQELITWCEEYQGSDDSGIFPDDNNSDVADNYNNSYSSQFGNQFVAIKSNTYTFSDGLKVEVYSTNDSRCSRGLTCVWEGEVSTLLRVSGGTVTGVGYKEIRLGTVSGATISQFGYTFNLLGGDKDSIQLIVSSGQNSQNQIYNNNTNRSEDANQNTNTTNNGGNGWVY